MELPAGFYWVRWTGRLNEPWTVAELREEDGLDDDWDYTIVQYWYVIGSSFTNFREEFEQKHEIGKRIGPGVS